MPVLISGFCTAITESTGYFDMNYAILAKVDKISFQYLNHKKGPIELSALMAFCFPLPASCINRKSLFLVLFNPYSHPHPHSRLSLQTPAPYRVKWRTSCCCGSWIEGSPSMRTSDLTPTSNMTIVIFVGLATGGSGSSLLLWGFPRWQLSPPMGGSGIP